MNIEISRRHLRRAHASAWRIRGLYTERLIWELGPITSIETSLKPIFGQGRVELTRKIRVETNMLLKLWGIHKDIHSVVFRTLAVANVTSSTSFRAVEGGRLAVGIKTEKEEVDASCKVDVYGAYDEFIKVPVIGPSQDELIRGLTGTKMYEYQTRKLVKEQASHSMEILSDLEAALNGQGQFVFPGGGTFDMKDPIFNKAGDLMIGLAYVKGDS